MLKGGQRTGRRKAWSDCPAVESPAGASQAIAAPCRSGLSERCPAQRLLAAPAARQPEHLPALPAGVDGAASPDYKSGFKLQLIAAGQLVLIMYPLHPFVHGCRAFNAKLCVTAICTYRDSAALASDQTRHNGKQQRVVVAQFRASCSACH